jgi:hypothetical protein
MSRCLLWALLLGLVGVSAYAAPEDAEPSEAGPVEGAQGGDVDNDLSGEIKDLNWLGFQQLKEASRVFVRTTEPVRFSIDNSQENLIVVVLENTRIPLRNNRRPLDTQFFNSPVRLVAPKVIEGPSPSVRIEIYLRDKVPFTHNQADNVLSIFFQRL